MVRKLVALSIVFGCGLSLGYVLNISEKTRDQVVDAVKAALPTTTPASITVTVGGRVHSPGPQTLSSGSTLSAAVIAAGGPTEFGAPRRVRLYRNSKAYVYDLTDPTHQLVQVHHGDTIDMPQKLLLGR